MPVKKIFTVLAFVLLFLSAWSNNVVISSVSTVVTASTTQVKFSLTWSNSWRTSTLTQNWDAVWVFIKYKDGNGVWRHLDLTGSDNVVPSNFAITIPADKKGAFIHRSVDGIGNVSLVDVRLGVVPVAGIFNIQVLGIEMVYIPEGNFYVGDGTAAGTFNSSGTPAQITNALTNAIKGNSLGDDAQLKMSGVRIDGDGGLDKNNDGFIDNANFPTGFKAFFCMKYEISKRAYIDFLNDLSYSQQISCTDAATAPNSPVGTTVLGTSNIEISTPGSSNGTPAVYSVDGDNDNIFNEANDGEWKAVQLSQWKYLCAYLDWAALRPLTELEYEKICRGSSTPVPNEFAWGTPSVFSTPYTFTNAGRSNELISNASTSSTVGNAYYIGTSGTQSALRNGIFATSLSSRVQAGAGFYGVMEMSGNMTEATVTLGNAAGRSFTGRIGNGELNSVGSADVDFWPGLNGNVDNQSENLIYNGSSGVTGTAGSGSRGIGFVSVGGSEMQVSNRSFATSTGAVVYGGRGVRQQPYDYIPDSEDTTIIDMGVVTSGSSKGYKFRQMLSLGSASYYARYKNKYKIKVIIPASANSNFLEKDFVVDESIGCLPVGVPTTSFQTKLHPVVRAPSSDFIVAVFSDILTSDVFDVVVAQQSDNWIPAQTAIASAKDCGTISPVPGCTNCNTSNTHDTAVLPPAECNTTCWMPDFAFFPFSNFADKLKIVAIPMGAGKVKVKWINSDYLGSLRVTPYSAASCSGVAGAAIFTKCGPSGCGPGECTSGEVIYSGSIGSSVSFKIEAFGNAILDCTGIPVESCSNFVLII